MGLNLIVISLLEVLILLIPMLLGVAYVTVAERKTMASMQRRLGPNMVGYYGLLQAFADALKLIVKEYVAPTQSNIILFFLGPVITLFFSLIGYAVIPFFPFSWVGDLKLGVLYILAVSSIATYGILLAGWSANSKFAFLGSIRSTAQLISYELVLSSIIILIVMVSSSFNLNTNIQLQKSVWLCLPIFPILLMFFIGAVAETNRAPFDLAEAESELVSGFMTEHSSVIFVFFFLAEYASILLMCILTSIFFFGGYNIWFDIDYSIIIDYITEALSYINIVSMFYFNYIPNSSYFILGYKINILLHGLMLGLKSSVLVFIFIWVRASFPRVRFDQLMTFCWVILLPILFGLILLMPSVLRGLNSIYVGSPF